MQGVMVDRDDYRKKMHIVTQSTLRALFIFEGAVVFILVVFHK